MGLSARVTPNSRNHSLAGLAAVLGLPSPSGLVASVLALILGVVVAARLMRHGDELAGLAVALLTGLLASPVSWEHHWVAAYPSMVLLLREPDVAVPHRPRWSSSARSA